MAEPPATRPSLLLRLRDLGDGRAWGAFTELYGPLIYSAGRGRGLQDADAEDLVQGVFQAVARSMGRGDFDPTRGSFRGWLFCIARNLIADLLARQARQPRGTGATGAARLLEAHPDADAADAALFEAEYRRRLLHWAAGRVRGEFTELTWSAFWRAGVEGRPAPEVAVELGTTVGNVYHCKSRVMARLRREIAEVEGAGGLTGDAS